MPDFSAFEVAAVIVTLIAGAGNIIQYVLARKSKSLHASDVENIYTTAYRAVENLDLAIQAASQDGSEKTLRYAYAAKATVNSIREKCQNRLWYLENRKPVLRPPWDAERLGE